MANNTRAFIYSDSETLKKLADLLWHEQYTGATDYLYENGRGYEIIDNLIEKLTTLTGENNFAVFVTTGSEDLSWQSGYIINGTQGCWLHGSSYEEVMNPDFEPDPNAEPCEDFNLERLKFYQKHWNDSEHDWIHALKEFSLKKTK